MDLEKYARDLRQGSGAASRETEQMTVELLKKVDPEKLAAAAKAGDMQALGKMINSLLSTPEGQSFAREVRKAVGQDGR